MNIPLKMSIRTKMLVYILATSIGVLAAIGIYIQFRTYRMAINDAHKIAISYSGKVVNQIQSELDLDIGFSRALAHSLQGYYKYDSITRDSIYFDIAKRLVQENPRYVSVWYNLEQIGRASCRERV